MYWALPGAFIHKTSLLELDLETFIQALLLKSVLTVYEFDELMALREKLTARDVIRRLVCLVAFKPVHDQAVFRRMLDDVARRLAASIVEAQSACEWINEV